MSSRPDWQARTACSGSHPELFYPEGTEGPALRAVARAERICAVCPAWARCLDWAVEGVGLTSQ
ncbi:MAG: WhiB family transcriptional regulator, redox-sensing transcriptional regulator [Trebonia sp.]|jgi:WhiB family transcriptional regulator, redox-sensing transcriptional regulator|nr:WhiB family transcriptional regulator, redox-sensing transcriptional regulator [Trebonia sp.]